MSREDPPPDSSRLLRVISVRAAFVACVLALLAHSSLNAAVQEGHTNRTRYASSLPDAVTESDLRAFARLLQLAPPQEQYAHHAWEMYQERWGQVAKTYALPLEALSRDAAALSDVSLLAPAYAAFAEEEERARAAFVTLDQSLFDSIRSFLAEPQQPLLQRVIDRRFRAQCWVSGICDVRASTIDLSKWCEEMHAEHAEVLAQLDPLLMEYEARLTPLYRAIMAQWTTTRVDKYRLVASKLTGDRDTADAALRAHLQSRLPTQTRVRELNDQFVVRFAASLPTASARELQARYRLMAYMNTYAGEINLLDPLERFRDSFDDGDRKVELHRIIDTYAAASCVN